jgi:glycosyltransferase involved in cell wall biosynthesis
MELNNQFSIVVISYNNKNEFYCCLNSLNYINYPKENYEIIVVDDGSIPPLLDDSTITLHCTHQITYIPRSTVSSRSKARNTGATLATREFLVFIDGDQYVNPDLLINYNAALMQNEALAAILGTRIDLTEWQSSYFQANQNYSQLKKITRSQQDFRNLIRTHYQNEFINTLGTWILFWSHNFLIRKTAFDKIGGFDEAFLGWGCEDVELGYRLTKNQLLFDFIENHVFHFHETNKFNPGKYLNSLVNLQYFYNKFKDISIMFKLGFYESFYNLDTNKISQEHTLYAFQSFSKKLFYITKWNPDSKS